MAENNVFFSVWTQNAPYWLIVEGAGAAKLPGFSAIYDKPTLCARKVEARWSEPWMQVAEALRALSPSGSGYRAAVMAGDALPGSGEVAAALGPVRDINAVAGNLWLLEDLAHGELGCHMQRVVNRASAQVGFEAFARMESQDGGVIGGGAIMKAAAALAVEYPLDQLLHRKAVEHFVARGLDGYLFINFLTGFADVPEVYLEGLGAAVAKAQVPAGSVVLDVPLVDYVRDLAKLQSIADYCHRRGFALSLDDVMTADGLAALLADIRPAFVKLDGKFGAGMKEAKRAATLAEIIRIAHANGALVLAEGVESKSVYEAYFAAGVDLFQGYLFGAPQGYEHVDAPRAAALAGA